MREMESRGRSSQETEKKMQESRKRLGHRKTGRERES